jgi:hypothetical protein
MVSCSRLAKLSLLALFLAACSPLSVSSPPTPTALPPTPTAPTATPTETPVEATATPPPGPCEIVADSEVTVYQRPSLQAQVFGAMTPGVRVLAEGRTADGWLGFDPGVAQAANVGIFRLRWVEGSSGVRLERGCDALPELVGPAPGICFSMPMSEVQVYAAPDLSSQVIATMVVGDYAAVTGRTGDGWAKVDLSVGNTGVSVTGWIEGGTLNLNGPCEDLLTVEL